MRRTVVPFCLLVCIPLASLLSCMPGSPGKADRSPALDPDGFMVLREPEPRGLVLSPDASIWVDRDGRMEATDSLTLLEEVEWLGNRQAKPRAADGEARDFVQVRLVDGQEVWVLATMVAEAAIPGFTGAEGAVVYKKPDLGYPDNRRIPPESPLAVHPGTRTRGFVMVSAWLPREEPLALVWVKEAALLQRQEDVFALRMYSLALGARDAVVQRELLANAQLVQTIYAPRIQAALDNLAQGAVLGSGSVAVTPAPATTTTASPAAAPAPAVGGARPGSVPVAPGSAQPFVPGIREATQSAVNVRDRPTTTGSQVLARLDLGYRVRVLERTAEESTIAGLTAPWFRIEEPAGWVFGAYLKEAAP